MKSVKVTGKSLNDGFKRNSLYINDNELIILCTETSKELSGVVIAPGMSPYKGGEYSTCWASNQFSKFTGSVLLED